MTHDTAPAERTGTLDEYGFDAWHVPFGSWQHAFCNRCAMACDVDEPCDCCDLEDDR